MFVQHIKKNIYSLCVVESQNKIHAINYTILILKLFLFNKTINMTKYNNIYIFIGT